jgi:hypothetical protein
MKPTSCPPGVDVDAFVWHHAICPSCGDDWWHGSDPRDGLTTSDLEKICAILGACSDCRDQPRPSRAARRAMARGDQRR